MSTITRKPGKGGHRRGRWLVAGGLLLAGCVPVPVYVTPTPVPAPAPSPSKFDRSWAAAVGALQDQDVPISTQDRTTGTVRGTRAGIEVVGTVISQADGSVRVEFKTSGATSTDPGLITRINQSYERRMGR